MFAALTALGIAGVPPPPPITVVSPPVAPPIAAFQRPKPVTFTFDAVIRHDNELLWQGRLAMASNGSAGFSQQRDQTVACVGPDGRDFAGRFPSNFRLALSSAYDMRDQAAIHVSARLERPTSDGPLQAVCDGLITRAVEVQATIHPESGKPVTVAGDAGFSVTLTLW